MKNKNAVNVEEMFAEMLDECYPVVTIGGLRYMPSEVLKRTDPIAFRCGANDYADSLLADNVLIAIDGEYYLN